MADIKVQRVQGVGSKKLSNRELYALVCYHYPAYTLKMAQDLPARDLNLLLKTARKQNALKMRDLVSIVSAPHAKDKNTVKKLSDHFGNLAKD